MRWDIVAGIVKILLVVGGIVAVFYGIQHFLGDGALFVSVVGSYILLHINVHTRKKNTLNEVVEKSADQNDTYQLALLLKTAIDTSPESIEVRKILNKLIKELTPK